VSADVVGILLAGGAARRFGSNKLLHPLPDGTPIAVASLRNLSSALPRVVAVVRPGVTDLAMLLSRAGAEVTVCERAEEGMGRTLAHAVGAARDAAGWVVALADMPFVAPSTIGAVARAVSDGANLVAPAFEGARGHPVGFGPRFLAQLLALEGDAGARDIVKAHGSEMLLLPVADPGVLRDIDTPADLE
jgi:molybdenum cofactor cytidylyltransferase